MEVLSSNPLNNFQEPEACRRRHRDHERQREVTAQAPAHVFAPKDI